MDSKKIGLFLAQLRKDKNLTQVNLAKSLNVTHQAISRWENGDSIPDIQSLVNIARLYDITVDEIVNYKLSNNKMTIKFAFTKFQSIYLVVFSILIYMLLLVLVYK